MPFSESFYLPSYEELKVPEIPLTFPAFKAASHHLGKYCDNQCKEFMLCKSENGNDPRPCLNEGKEVTSCGLEFFRKIKNSPCAESFIGFSTCMDKCHRMEFRNCRKYQKLFDKCMAEHLNQERPEHGYFTKVRLHDTSRPKPKPVDVGEPLKEVKPTEKEPKTKFYRTQGFGS